VAALEDLGQAAAFLEDNGGLPGLVPEIGFGGDFFNFREARLLLLQIKDDLGVE